LLCTELKTKELIEMEEARKVAEGLCTFIDKSPSPYHAVESVRLRLETEGFQRIRESGSWKSQLNIGDKYYYTRNGTSIVAFVIGSKFKPNSTDSRFLIIGAHSDSPCFKVKPKSKIESNGYLQLGVECYGGALWYSWFDRDLTLAGRLILSNHTNKLVHIERPILRIPSLAIHLSREVATDGFKPNKESHTTPILGFVSDSPSSSSNQPKDDVDFASKMINERLSQQLLSVLAQEAQIQTQEIVDFELVLADTQPCAIGGIENEFVFAPRLDNLASSFTATEALIESLNLHSIANCTNVRSIVLFDHEEVGSDSYQGAGSPMLRELLQRVTAALSDEHNVTDAFEAILHRSFLVSADMAHALHPNYSGKHELRHQPGFGRGLVVKTNQNQRYATTVFSGYVIREMARLATRRYDWKFVPIQEFVVPNDTGCGSTIGPILASGAGIRTVDVGQAQLAMHSIREMCAVSDTNYVKLIFAEFFASFNTISDLSDDLMTL